MAAGFAGLVAPRLCADATETRVDGIACVELHAGMSAQALAVNCLQSAGHKRPGMQQHASRLQVIPLGLESYRWRRYHEKRVAGYGRHNECPVFHSQVAKFRRAGDPA